MRFSSLFGTSKKPQQVAIGCDSLSQQPSPTCDSLGYHHSAPQPISGYLSSPQPISAKIEFPARAWFLPTQIKWLDDNSPLRIWEKSRQVGATKTDALDSVFKASPADAKFDVWVTSRDEIQARLYLDDCKDWATIFNLAATDLGVLLLDPKNNFSAYVLQFANGRRIYCLSSNPNALAGKRGHVKIDEFALHPDQRLLYRIAKPVTQWGGTLSIISTHRGHNTLFNQIIQDIRHNGNPMGWSLHSYPIQKAVEEGIVARINEKSGRNETDEQFLKRLRAECIDEEQWLQEYCCIPADESSAFFGHDLITACEDPHLKLLSFEELKHSLSGGSSWSSSSSSVSRFNDSTIQRFNGSFFLGVDVARKHDLCVLDVGEKIGDVLWDRCRIELQNKTFSEIEFELYRFLELPQLKRACIDATGLGMQLAERARERFGWKVEPVTFSASVKEELAFGLRRDFEDRKLRLVRDDKLRSDLRGLRKEVTSSGNIRFAGESIDSHCDRTWAKALRQHAARYRVSCGGAVA
jgi:Mu-like prophage FluMu protein gp28